MEKTAVEWLAKELEGYGDPGMLSIEWETLDELVKQARSIEKTQIEDAFGYAQMDLGMDPEEYIEWRFNS